MIYSDKYKFVFVHIPKCAGLSVRVQLLHKDFVDFCRVRAHEELGEVDCCHIPNETMREYFPENYRRLVEYYSVAIVRDPMYRFSSSFTQHVKMYGYSELRNMKSREIYKSLDTVMSHLGREGCEKFLGNKYIHFQPQNHFLYDRGARVVDKVYFVDAMDEFYEDLFRRFGFLKPNLDYVHTNKSNVYRSPSIELVYKFSNGMFGGVVKKYVPSFIQGFILDMVYTNARKYHEKIFFSEEVRDFVFDFYHKDYDVLRDIGFL